MVLFYWCAYHRCSFDPRCEIALTQPEATWVSRLLCGPRSKYIGQVCHRRVHQHSPARTAVQTPSGYDHEVGLCQ